MRPRRAKPRRESRLVRIQIHPQNAECSYGVEGDVKNLHNRLSVQAKMLGILGVGLLGFSAYFLVNYVILQSYAQSMEKIVRQQLPVLELNNDIYNAMGVLRSAATQAVLTQNFEGIGRVDRADKIILAAFDLWAQKNLPHHEDALELRKQYVAVHEKLNDILQNIVAGISQLASVQGDYKDSVGKLVEVENGLTALRSTINTELQSAVDQAEASGRTAMATGFALLFCAILSTIFFYYVLSGVNQSLKATNGSLQMTSKRLLEMVDEAQISSNQLRETSNRQSSSSTETVVSMEEMKRLLSQTSMTSVNAVRLSEASFQEANDGKEIVQGLKDAMLEIDRSNTELEEVNQVVRLIRERTNVINEIVFKTQMLSFNANIEAARAGQHGLGFAVVATEMGSLADMSGKAAQQINELLDKSANKVESTVLRTKEKIGNANELSARCYDFFKLLTDRSGQLKEMVDSISAASAEQNSGVDYVVNAMNDLNNTAAESDRMAQGIAMLADGLKTHAIGLATAVDSLSILVRGQRRAVRDLPKGPGGSIQPKRPVLKVYKESA